MSFPFSKSTKNSKKYISQKKNSSSNYSSNESQFFNEESKISTNFTIPIEALCLDESLIKAQVQVEKAITDEEIFNANNQLTAVEHVAENHAILEATMNLKLLENNVEIIVHSWSMKKSILEYLLEDAIPVYFYGIIDSNLSEKVIVFALIFLNLVTFRKLKYSFSGLLYNFLILIGFKSKEYYIFNGKVH